MSFCSSDIVYTVLNKKLCITLILHNPEIFRKGKADDQISKTLRGSYDLEI